MMDDGGYASFCGRTKNSERLTDVTKTHASGLTVIYGNLSPRNLPFFKGGGVQIYVKTQPNDPKPNNQNSEFRCTVSNIVENWGGGDKFT